MKRIKSIIAVTLCVLSVGLLTGCGGMENEETGSNTDSGNNTQSTGVVEEIVTDAATAAEDIATGAADVIEDIATGAADLLDGGMNNNDNSAASMKGSDNQNLSEDTMLPTNALQSDTEATTR